MRVITNNGILDVLELHPDDFEVVGVAKALSRIIRFCGNFEFPMSVAQHSVVVCQVVKQMGGDLEDQLAALHHDDAEFITGDVSSPIKEMCPGFQEIENVIMDMIDEMYGIDTRSDIVKEADKQVGLAERDFHTSMTPGQARVMEDLKDRVLSFTTSTIFPWDRHEALARYLDLHSTLVMALDTEDDEIDLLPPAKEDEELLN